MSKITNETYCECVGKAEYDYEMNRQKHMFEKRDSDVDMKRWIKYSFVDFNSQLALDLTEKFEDANSNEKIQRKTDKNGVKMLTEFQKKVMDAVIRDIIIMSNRFYNIHYAAEIKDEKKIFFDMYSVIEHFKKICSKAPYGFVPEQIEFESIIMCACSSIRFVSIYELKYENLQSAITDIYKRFEICVKEKKIIKNFDAHSAVIFLMKAYEQAYFFDCLVRYYS